MTIVSLPILCLSALFAYCLFFTAMRYPIFLSPFIYLFLFYFFSFLRFRMYNWKCVSISGRYQHALLRGCGSRALSPSFPKQCAFLVCLCLFRSLWRSLDSSSHFISVARFCFLFSFPNNFMLRIPSKFWWWLRNGTSWIYKWELYIINLQEDEAF